MAKMRQSTRTAAAKSTKRTSAKAAKPAQSAKPASGKTTAKTTGARSAKKKATAARSTKARAGTAPKTTKKPATASGRSAKSRSGASTKPSSQSSRGAAKKANSRSSAGKRTTASRSTATLDRWCKECTDSLRKLVGSTPAKTGRRKRTSRATRQKEAQRWVGSTARQLGLGVRRGAELADPRKLFAGTGKKIRPIKFNSVTNFCKKELATLAGRLNKLANNPPHRRRKRTRK